MQALRLANVRKHYGETIAVGGVDVAFETGRVHAVVGENGAGKSTLLKIAAGIVPPDGGEIFIEDKPLRPHTAAEAIRRGVGMVQQHFALIPVFSVIENMVLGAEPVTTFGRLDLHRARDRAAKLLDDLGASISLDDPVEALGVGDRQRLEIARVLYRNARILILDEPTAVLTPHEAEALYGSLRRLAAAGSAVVVVTHKIDEIVTHADAVTVLRRGKHIETRAIDRSPSERGVETSRLTLAIMGDDLPQLPRPSSHALGGPTLVLKQVNLGRALHDVNCEVRSAEIVGVAGVEGNGQYELAQVIAGDVRPDSGTVWVKSEGNKGSPHAARAAVVHEDRHKEGLVLDADVGENLLLGELSRFSVMGFLRQGKIDQESRVREARAQVKPPGLWRIVRGLSGGNQQKIVVARALSRVEEGCGALVLAHPTRGVDVLAARAIHEQILEIAARRRVAVLVISSDLNELRTLCHRILVMARGKIVDDLPPTATDAELGARMLEGRVA